MLGQARIFCRGDGVAAQPLIVIKSGFSPCPPLISLVRKRDSNPRPHHYEFGGQPIPVVPDGSAYRLTGMESITSPFPLLSYGF
jgi:hypothetical protein